MEALAHVAFWLMMFVAVVAIAATPLLAVYVTYRLIMALIARDKEGL